MSTTLNPRFGFRMQQGGSPNLLTLLETSGTAKPDGSLSERPHCEDEGRGPRKDKPLAPGHTAGGGGMEPDLEPRAQAPTSMQPPLISLG